MADKNNDKKKPPPQPIKRVQVGGEKKPPPQPIKRVQVGGEKKPPPQPIRRVKVGGDKQPPQPIRRVQVGSGAVPPRVRPTVRAAQHQKKVAARPLPTPPQRRVVPKAAVAGAAAAGTVAAVSAATQAKVDAVQDKFERLETSAQLGSIYDAVGRIDTRLTELLFDLEQLRDRGYVHSGQLEDKLETLDDQWDDDIRPRVEANLKEQVARLDQELDQAENTVKHINPRVETTIKAAETAVDSLERRINAAQDAIDNLYDGIEAQLGKAYTEINKAGTMLNLLAASPTLALREAEGPLTAVEAEWQKDGDEGPNGYLFLTDQRLIFEQREEIVTKKTFGLFKSESEMVQQVHIDVEAHQIESVAHKEEGGFMGVGKEDILELVFTADAPVSRARFHLKGQNSSEWAALIKSVQTGEIDQDRCAEYVDELEESGITSASFPSQCPNCFAPIPQQPRGVTSYTCGFCGVVVQPETA
jgi:ribosome-associated translation inhibitor RaiA